jgi:hypothetical protein
MALTQYRATQPAIKPGALPSCRGSLTTSAHAANQPRRFRLAPIAPTPRPLFLRVKHGDDHRPGRLVARGAAVVTFSRAAMAHPRPEHARSPNHQRHRQADASVAYHRHPDHPAHTVCGTSPLIRINEMTPGTVSHLAGNHYSHRGPWQVGVISGKLAGAVYPTSAAPGVFSSDIPGQGPRDPQGDEPPCSVLVSSGSPPCQIRVRQERHYRGTAGNVGHGST